MHLHTHHSVDGLITVREAKKAIESGRVDVIALTDHDTISSWKEFRKLPVIFGMEKTIIEENGNKFHLLIYFMNGRIKGATFNEVMDEVREQGALASIAHPYDRLRHAPTRVDKYAKHVDALECLNARCMMPLSNYFARRYAEKHHIPMTAGSDAHHYSEIGSAYVECDADDLDEFRKLLLKRKVKLRGGGSLPHIHIYSSLKRYGVIHPNY